MGNIEKRPGRPELEDDLKKKPKTFKLSPAVCTILEELQGIKAGPYVEKAVEFYHSLAPDLPELPEEKRVQFVENAIALYVAILEGRVKLQEIPPDLHGKIFRG